jgi:hypothetical protein
MNTKQILALVCTVIFQFPALAQQKCRNDNPQFIAERFYSAHADFYYANPDEIKDVISNRFFIAMEKEYKCKQGELCAIEANPWTDAQDGDMGKPVVFTTVSISEKKVLIQMDYTFMLSDIERRVQKVTLVFERLDTNACWLLSDFITPSGGSLLEYVEKWHSEYGEN